ncbi:unnamed protein product [Onchocerca flexuosa]|uniref:Ovule protein n=1 Tax=Onchocerca flexuosa TaxID=387005 RepID=A0A183H8E9_9BILA|nr:unnamed protein product [Onchocerca flexuosa]
MFCHSPKCMKFSEVLPEYLSCSPGILPKMHHMQLPFISSPPEATMTAITSPDFHAVLSSSLLSLHFRTFILLYFD